MAQSRISELIEGGELPSLMTRNFVTTSDNMEIPKMSLVTNDFVFDGHQTLPLPSLDYYDGRRQ